MRDFSREELYDRPRLSIIGSLVAVEVLPGRYIAAHAAFGTYSPDATDDDYLVSRALWNAVLDARSATSRGVPSADSRRKSKHDDLVQLTIHTVVTADPNELGAVPKGHRRLLTDNPAHLPVETAPDPDHPYDLVCIPGEQFRSRVLDAAAFPPGIHILLPGQHAHPWLLDQGRTRPAVRNISLTSSYYSIYRDFPADAENAVPKTVTRKDPRSINPDALRNSRGDVLINEWNCTQFGFTHFPNKLSPILVPDKPPVGPTIDADNNSNSRLLPSPDGLGYITNPANHVTPLRFQVHKLTRVWKTPTPPAPSSPPPADSPELPIISVASANPIIIPWPIIPPANHPTSPHVGSTLGDERRVGHRSRSVARAGSSASSWIDRRGGDHYRPSGERNRSRSPPGRDSRSDSRGSIRS